MRTDYDLIVVGGGLGGAALAKAMAEQGVRVLVIEREQKFSAWIHTFTSWVYKLFYETGPDADARRTRALPLLAEDLSRMPDAIFSGPEVTLDETARKRFFGEE